MAKNKQTKRLDSKNEKRTIREDGSQKEKRTIREDASTDREKSIWKFTNLDKAGEFAFDLRRDDFQHDEVLDKMIHYSNMTWAEIKRQTHDNGRSKHHTLDYEKLSKAAQNRIRAKHLDEKSDQIFSFGGCKFFCVYGSNKATLT